MKPHCTGGMQVHCGSRVTLSHMRVFPAALAFGLTSCLFAQQASQPSGKFRSPRARGEKKVAASPLVCAVPLVEVAVPKDTFTIQKIAPPNNSADNHMSVGPPVPACSKVSEIPKKS